MPLHFAAPTSDAIDLHIVAADALDDMPAAARAWAQLHDLSDCDDIAATRHGRGRLGLAS